MTPNNPEYKTGGFTRRAGLVTASASLLTALGVRETRAQEAPQVAGVSTEVAQAPAPEAFYSNLNPVFSLPCPNPDGTNPLSLAFTLHTNGENPVRTPITASQGVVEQAKQAFARLGKVFFTPDGQKKDFNLIVLGGVAENNEPPLPPEGSEKIADTVINFNQTQIPVPTYTYKDNDRTACIAVLTDTVFRSPDLDEGLKAAILPAVGASFANTLVYPDPTQPSTPEQAEIIESISALFQPAPEAAKPSEDIIEGPKKILATHKQPDAPFQIGPTDTFNQLEEHLANQGVNRIEIKYNDSLGNPADNWTETSWMKVCPTLDDPRCKTRFIELNLKVDSAQKSIRLELKLVSDVPSLSDQDKEYLNIVFNSNVADFISIMKYGDHMAMIPDPKLKLEAEQNLLRPLKEISGLQFLFK